jgi:hypothetical protein
MEDATDDTAEAGTGEITGTASVVLLAASRMLALMQGS